MHVAILCEYGTVNGGENSIVAMVQRLTEIEVIFLAPPTGRLAERLANARLRHVPLSLMDAAGRRLPRDAALQVIQAAVASVRPDVLHANSLAMGRLTGALRPALQIPTTAHLRDILRLNRSTVADLNRNDALVCVSRETLAAHLEQGLDAGRAHVVYNGIDSRAFQSGARTGFLHAELGLSPSSPLIATIGQITLRKGHDLFVAAALQTAAKLPDAHWLIVGERYSDKPETIEFDRQMRQKAEAGGMGDRIHWLGYRDDAAQLLAEIDLLVHPARQEPLGRVLLEASAVGVPIIATRVGGTAEILEDGQTGLLVPPDDPHAIALVVIELINDRPRRAALGRAARTSIARHFDLPTQADELAAVWQRLT